MKKQKHLDIASWLRGAREEAGLTQLEAAKTLGHSTAQYISNVERGLSAPSIKTSITLCEAYGISKRELYELMTGIYETGLKKQLKIR